MPLKQLEHLKLCGHTCLERLGRPRLQFTVLATLAIAQLKALQTLDLSHTSLTLHQVLPN